MEYIEVSPNTCDLGNEWLERELQHIKFGDKRLTKRLIKTGTYIEGKASGSINQSCKGWRDAKGAYRLFSNKKFDPAEVYSSHYQSTKERIKGKKLIFAIQDTSYLDFDSHLKTKGLGSISKAYTKHKMGLMLHSILILSIEGATFRAIFSAMLVLHSARRDDPRKIKKKIYALY